MYKSKTATNLHMYRYYIWTEMDIIGKQSFSFDVYTCDIHWHIAYTYSIANKQSYFL